MDVRLQPSAASAAGVSLQSIFSAQANSIALFPTPTDPSSKSASTSGSGYAYLAQYGATQLERRELKVSTYTVWTSLQTIASELSGSHEGKGLKGGPSEQLVQYLNRISKLYQQKILDQLAATQEDATQEEHDQAEELQHLASLHAVLSLAEILYIPADGRGDGVVGEEILDWLNTVDRAPSTEEGEELADLSRPWEHPNWWDYINKCITRAHLLSAVALLKVVGSHPSPIIRQLSQLSVALLESFPRSTSFASESRFLSNLSSWRSKAKSATRQAEDLFAQADEDELLGGEQEAYVEWVAGFRTVFELLEGRESRVLETCEDWREALGAWGVWVNAGGRREDLPDTLSLIVKHHPVDTTLPSESIQSSLLLGDVSRALQQSNTLSSWLVAHLADILDKVEVIELPEPESGLLPLREHFLLAYTDGLLADPSMWRIAVDYLASCGEEGKARMKRVILSVDLEEPAKDAQGDGMDVEGEEKDASSAHALVEDVLAACAQYGLEEEVVSVCKVYSEILIAKQRYGEAVSFCVRAGDAKRIARIAERVLDEYIQNGQEAFVRHVDSIPTSLLRPGGTALRPELFGREHQHVRASTADGDEAEDELLLTKAALTPYSARLTFLARWRDFFALYARGEKFAAAGLLVRLISSNVAPKSFHGVMLLDAVPLLESDEIVVSLDQTYELLRALEDITAPIEASNGLDVYGHLTSLARIVGATGSEEEQVKRAMRQLEIVRGALARHLGRVCCL